MKKKSGRVSAAQVLAFVLLILFDQWTKNAAVAALKGKTPIVLIDGVLELYYLENTGAAFSMFQNAKWFFAVIAIAAIVIIAWFLTKMPETKRMLPMRICLVLIAAGAAGNLIDRLALSYVRDFIYFVIINFPVFNVADIYVTVATFLLILFVIFKYKDDDFAFLHGNRKTDKAKEKDKANEAAGTEAAAGVQESMQQENQDDRNT